MRTVACLATALIVWCSLASVSALPTRKLPSLRWQTNSGKVETDHLTQSRNQRLYKTINQLFFPRGGETDITFKRTLSLPVPPEVSDNKLVHRALTYLTNSGSQLKLIGSRGTHPRFKRRTNQGDASNDIIVPYVHRQTESHSDSQHTNRNTTSAPHVYQDDLIQHEQEMTQVNVRNIITHQEETQVRPSHPVAWVNPRTNQTIMHNSDHESRIHEQNANHIDVVVPLGEQTRRRPSFPIFNVTNELANDNENADSNLNINSLNAPGNNYYNTDALGRNMPVVLGHTFIPQLNTESSSTQPLNSSSVAVLPATVDQRSETNDGLSVNSPNQAAANVSDKSGIDFAVPVSEIHPSPTATAHLSSLVANLNHPSYQPHLPGGLWSLSVTLESSSTSSVTLESPSTSSVTLESPTTSSVKLESSLTSLVTLESSSTSSVTLESSSTSLGTLESSSTPMVTLEFPSISITNFQTTPLIFPSNLDNSKAVTSTLIVISDPSTTVSHRIEATKHDFKSVESTVANVETRDESPAIVQPLEARLLSTVSIITTGNTPSSTTTSNMNSSTTTSNTPPSNTTSSIPPSTTTSNTLMSSTTKPTTSSLGTSTQFVTSSAERLLGITLSQFRIRVPVDLHPHGDPPPAVDHQIQDSSETGVIAHVLNSNSSVIVSGPRPTLPPDHPQVPEDETEVKATTSSPGRSSLPPHQASQPSSMSEHENSSVTRRLPTATSQASPQNTSTDNSTDAAPAYLELKLGMSCRDFCQKKDLIRGELAEILLGQSSGQELTLDQVRVSDPDTQQCLKPESCQQLEEIRVRLYLLDETDHVDRNLTLLCAHLLQPSTTFPGSQNSIIKKTLLSINVYDTPVHADNLGFKGGLTQSDNTNDDNYDSNSDPRVTVAVVLAVVGGICCISLIGMQVVVRRRKMEMGITPPANGSYGSRRTNSMRLSWVKSRGQHNAGLDLSDPPDPTHPLNFVQLSNLCMNEDKVEEEFLKLPQKMPRPSSVPPGEEDKNRYANILPLVHTRVKLVQDDLMPRSSYINASYVTGPNNQCQYYIATQAPTEKTVSDFWTMVWQQGSRVVVMLTQLEEKGQPKCVSYWPELVGQGAAHRYGHFQIELKQKDVQQEYIVSRLEVNNLRNIETRFVDHFWYTCWPPGGVPEAISLVKLVLDVRPKYEKGEFPLVVHCSPGTGRTCTFIALDLCMRQFEARRVVDIMKTVNSIRHERAGAVQNKEQYLLLYRAVFEYASILMTPGVSATSSVATLQALLTG